MRWVALIRRGNNIGRGFCHRAFVSLALVNDKGNKKRLPGGRYCVDYLSFVEHYKGWTNVTKEEIARALQQAQAEALKLNAELP